MSHHSAYLLSPVALDSMGLAEVNLGGEMLSESSAVLRHLHRRTLQRQLHNPHLSQLPKELRNSL